MATKQADELLWPDGWNLVEDCPASRLGAVRVVYVVHTDGRSVDIWKDEDGDYIDADAADAEAVVAALTYRAETKGEP